MFDWPTNRLGKKDASKYISAHISSDSGNKITIVCFILSFFFSYCVNFKINKRQREKCQIKERCLEFDARRT